jgi:transposase-like protein
VSDKRSLSGVKLIIADEHKGLKAAADKVLDATIQRCRVHFMRNALACVERRTSRSLANVYRERQALTWAALRTAL